MVVRICQKFFQFDFFESTCIDKQYSHRFFVFDFFKVNKHLIKFRILHFGNRNDFPYNRIIYNKPTTNNEETSNELRVSQSKRLRAFDASHFDRSSTLFLARSMTNANDRRIVRVTFVFSRVRGSIDPRYTCMISTPVVGQPGPYYITFERFTARIFTRRCVTLNADNFHSEARVIVVNWELQPEYRTGFLYKRKGELHRRKLILFLGLSIYPRESWPRTDDANTIISYSSIELNVFTQQPRGSCNKRAPRHFYRTFLVISTPEATCTRRATDNFHAFNAAKDAHWIRSQLSWPREMKLTTKLQRRSLLFNSFAAILTPRRGRNN